MLSGEEEFTNRTALQPSLLLLLSIGKEILLCHHIGRHPARLARPMPCQSRLWKKGSKPLGFVAYSVFLRSIVTHAAEGIVEDAAPYHENPSQVPLVPRSILLLRPNVSPVVLASRSCASHSTFVPRHLPKGPDCLRCVAHAAAVGRELKGMSYRLRFGPQGWESMTRAADHSVLKSRWSHASEMCGSCSVCFSSCHVSEVYVPLLSPSSMSSRSSIL